MFWLVVIAVLVALVVIAFRLRYRRPECLPLPALAAAPARLRSRTAVPDKVKVVVTGGSGQLGQRLLEVLLQDARFAPRIASITVFDVTVGRLRHDLLRYTTGDLTSASAVDDVIAQADLVFHMASIIDLRSGSRHWPLMHNVNVVGTHNVVEACIKHGVKGLVYTGSMASRKDGPQMREEMRYDVDADGVNTVFAVRPEQCVTHYGRSKLLAERAVISANGRDGSVLRSAAVLPCVVFGFNDRLQVQPLVEGLKAKKPSPGVIRIDGDESGVVSSTWSDSCAVLHAQCGFKLLGEDRDLIGGRSFFASDFHMDLATFYREAEKALVAASGGAWQERPVQFNLIPRPIVHILGTVMGFVDWLHDGCVRGDVYQLAFFDAILAYAMGDLRCYSDSAIKLLDFKPVSAKESLKRMAEQYVKQELSK